MKAALLKKGDTIGLIAPSWVQTKEGFAPVIEGLQQKGFQVKVGENFYKDTWQFSASAKERADDLNAMARDSEVKLVFFGGGDGAVELLPYVDFDAIRENPKLYLSYSDGTTILEAIRGRTGLVTYYGQTPGLFMDISDYDWGHFKARIMEGNPGPFAQNSRWRCIREGEAEGELIGGFLLNFALLQGIGCVPVSPQKKYLLFLETLEDFNSIPMAGAYLSHVAQSLLMPQVSGLLMGHFSDEERPLLYGRLERLGKKWDIPVAYCDDFGHGRNHGILPIGGQAVLKVHPAGSALEIL